MNLLREYFDRKTIGDGAVFGLLYLPEQLRQVIIIVKELQIKEVVSICP